MPNAKTSLLPTMYPTPPPMSGLWRGVSNLPSPSSIASDDDQVLKILHRIHNPIRDELIRYVNYLEKNAITANAELAKAKFERTGEWTKYYVKRGLGDLVYDDMVEDPFSKRAELCLLIV